jgi:hypothetical protein
MVVAKKDQEYIDRAYDLAYFIHANKGMALCVAEEAWCKLEHALDRQHKRRYYRLSGRRPRLESSSRSWRTKIGLREEHLLQCLVYAESDPWERATERGDSPYPLTEEDMIIRFIKHLVRTTVKRSSFYVTLGVGRLLYEYSTSEVRQMYDLLIQDEGRSRDNPYLRRQKALLMRDLLERFQGLIQTITTAQKEERFLAQPTTQRLIDFVNECLRRFTPWQTGCAVPMGFNPAQKIPALAFSGKEPDDEYPTETNRIHAVLHPDCFSRLASGLGFASPEKRLAVPQFFYSPGGAPRGDRLHPPKLEEEDYLRLHRTREERAKRRKVFLARRLRVYVDGIERTCFDPRQTTRVQLHIGPEADVLEVRGEDEQGELALATLLVRCYEIPVGGSFKDWIVLEGGQKVTIQLTPLRDANGDIEGAGVEVSYAETHPLRAISWLAQRAWFGLTEMVKRTREMPHGVGSDWSWLAKVGAAAALLAVVASLLWIQRQPSPPDLPRPPRADIPRPPETQPPAPPVPTPPPVQEGGSPLMARATWSQDPATALRAIPIESTRDEVARVDVSRDQAMLFISVPADDAASRKYARYRITLGVAEKRFWQQTLRAPDVSLTGRDHIVNVVLFPRRLPERDSYNLRIEGQTRSGWQELGSVRLSRESIR